MRLQDLDERRFNIDDEIARLTLRRDFLPVSDRSANCDRTGVEVEIFNMQTKRFACPGSVKARLRTERAE